MLYLDKIRKYYGNIHPATFSALNNLALIFKITGNYQEAKDIYERIVTGYSRLFGKEHNSTVTVMQNLANLYKEMKANNEALKLFHEVLEIRQKMKTDDQLQ